MSDSQKPDHCPPLAESPKQQAAASRETSRPADSVPIVSGQFANLPATFGRYQVERLLGRGAMGAVYLARDTQLDRFVALKIPKVTASGSKKLLLRLQTEAKAAAQLDHPSLCKVHDAGEINGQCFIAMQYIEGETLKAQLDAQSKTVAEAVSLILQLAEGLSEAHALGIIHRDLKPENIMINRRGMPVIMDFGLAKFSTLSSNAKATQAGMILGSPAYMSPEQASGNGMEIDQRSDIYSLGIVLFELLTGRWPFDGSAMQILGQKSLLEPPSPLDLKSELPPALAVICHKMIAKTKQNRYQTINDVIVDLKQVDRKLAVASPELLSAQLGVPFSPGADGAISVHAEAQIESSRVTQNKTSTLESGKFSAVSEVPNRRMPVWCKAPAMRWTALAAAALLLACGVIIVIRSKNGAQTTLELTGAEEVVIKSGKSHGQVRGEHRDNDRKATTKHAAEESLVKFSTRDLGGVPKGAETSSDAAAPLKSTPLVAYQVLPVGTVFKGKWSAYDGGTMVKEDRHTIKVIQRDGNQFVLAWELHDIFRKWKFTGTLSDDASTGNFTGEFTELLRTVDGIHPILGNNEVQGKISLDGTEISGRFVWNGTNKTAIWTATRAEPTSAAEEIPVHIGIKNGTFADGLDGWEIEGGAAAFNPFRYEGETALSTYGSNRERDTGRLFQTFKVPPDATTLSWAVHGGQPAGVYVSLLRGDNVYKRASGRNSNSSTRVVWDVEALRGETVTLEIVDTEIGPWGFIGANKFMFDAKD